MILTLILQVRNQLAKEMAMKSLQAVKCVTGKKKKTKKKKTKKKVIEYLSYSYGAASDDNCYTTDKLTCTLRLSLVHSDSHLCTPTLTCTLRLSLVHSDSHLYTPTSNCGITLT